MRYVVALVVALLVSSVLSQSSNISAVTAAGFDIILLDSPSWVTHIEFGYSQFAEFFVYGQTTLRKVVVDLNDLFVALPTTPWVYEMLDLHTFFIPNTTTQYSIGVSKFNPDNPIMFDKVIGTYLPLVLVKPTVQKLQGNNETAPAGFSANFNGMMFYSVRVDPSNQGDVQSYFVGFVPSPSTGPSDIAFGIVKTHTNVTGAGGIQGAQFWYNATNGVQIFYANKFTAFSSFYRPFVHIYPYYGANNVTLVIVADPNTRTVYAGFYDATDTWIPLINQLIDYPGYTLVSAAICFNQSTFYVGLENSGRNAGAIAVFNLGSPTSAPTIVDLPANASNPQALAVYETYPGFPLPGAGLVPYLYIGLNGGSEVLRFNVYTNVVDGYQRLPEYLHRSWAGKALPIHIYFVTNEQNSKVFRVHYKDFCSARCPYLGYCKRNACTCSTGYTLSADKSSCDATALIQEQNAFKQAHGGEIALGVFFTLAVVAAAAGWFLWYRARRGSYQPM